MKRTRIHSLNLFCFDRKWLIPFLFISSISLFLLLVTIPTQDKSNSTSLPQSKSSVLITNSGAGAHRLGLPELPRFAYLLSGTGGDAPPLKRLLQAVYHPRNSYLLHLDLEASDSDRLELAKYVRSETVIEEFKNVMVVGKANLVTNKGPTMMACTLHAVAILLKQAKWDWFINLSASDYPLVPQDG
ncbi:hypothetical protein CsSME_00017250 [Camellia sinensis var. sinensis]